MTSKSSKTLGIRMPFPIYMELLEKAQELRMPISDLGLQLIVYNKDKPFSVQREPDTSKELTDTKNALKRAELRFNDALEANQRFAKVEALHKAEIKKLTALNQKLETDNEFLRNKVITIQSEVQEFKAYAENNLMYKDGKPYRKSK
jgi:hypothetical protein